MTCGIYQIVNSVNGKRYVGSSVNIERRWKEHKRRLRANSHVNMKLQNIYNKYGSDSLVYSIIEECDETLLLSREQHHIDFKSELNILDVAGKTTGYKASPERKKKQSIVMRERWKDLSYREEQSKKSSQAAKEMWRNEEVRNKIIQSISDTKKRQHETGEIVSPLVALWKDDNYRASRTGVNNHNYVSHQYSFSHDVHGEITCSKLHLSKVYGVDRSDVNKLVSGKIRQIKGWKLEKAPEGA